MSFYHICLFFCPSRDLHLSVNLLLNIIPASSFPAPKNHCESSTAAIISQFYFSSFSTPDWSHTALYRLERGHTSYFWGLLHISLEFFVWFPRETGFSNYISLLFVLPRAYLVVFHLLAGHTTSHHCCRAPILLLEREALILQLVVRTCLLRALHPGGRFILV